MCRLNSVNNDIVMKRSTPGLSRNECVIRNKEEYEEMIIPTVVIHPVPLEDNSEQSTPSETIALVDVIRAGNSLPAGCSPSCLKSSQLVRQASDELNKSFLTSTAPVAQ